MLTAGSFVFAKSRDMDNFMITYNEIENHYEK